MALGEGGITPGWGPWDEEVTHMLKSSAAAWLLVAKIQSIIAC